MKKLTSQAVMDMMDESDWTGLHDVVLDAADLEESPSRSVLEQVVQRLDHGILGDAVKWGFGDTVVRDDVYVFVEDNVDEHGSLDAWLKCPVEADGDE